MAIDTTTADALLKERYSPDVILDIVYKDRPLLQMLKKDSKAGGDQWVQPVKYGDNQSISATAATAFAATANSSQVKFNVTYKKLYGKGSVDVFSMEASKGNADAFVRLFEYEMDNTLDSVARALAVQAYGAGTGKLGVIGSGLGATVTLATREDVSNFEPGMTIVLCESGSTTARTGTATVTSVNRNAGTLGFSTHLSGGITAAFATDHIFRQGNNGAATEWAGLSAWLPSTDPSSGDSFYGVDRSVEPVRLAGVRYNATGRSVREALVGAARLAQENGANPEYAFIHPKQFEALAIELDSNRSYTDLKGLVGFKAIEIAGPRGVLKVISDQDCPSTDGFLLDMKTWAIRSVGEVPHLQEMDGLVCLRNATADQVDFRVASYGNLVCSAPGRNARIINLGA